MPTPTPVAAEIILRHTAFFFFFRADRSSALQRAWQSSRDKERECAYTAVNATKPTFLVSQCWYNHLSNSTVCLSHTRILPVRTQRLRCAGNRRGPSPGGNGERCRCVAGHREFKELSSETGNEGKASLFSLPFSSLFFLSTYPSVLVRPPSPPTSAWYRNTELYKVLLKTPGGFLFNGASRGSAPAVWFINGTPTAALPTPLPPLQTSVMDWTTVGSCLLRKLFLAAGMLTHGLFLISYLSHPPLIIWHYSRISSPSIRFIGCESKINPMHRQKSLFMFKPQWNYKLNSLLKCVKCSVL